MDWPRSSGILVHPTSLPSPGGLGDIGPAAHRFVEFLAALDQHHWQFLPLGPTGFGESPYQCYSAFAGNPLLISPAGLVEDGLLPSDALSTLPAESTDQVDFAAVTPPRWHLLRRAAERFFAAPAADLHHEFEAFVAAKADWLEDFVLFAAIKQTYDGRPWWSWPAPLRTRDAGALLRMRQQLAGELALHRFVQWQFERQWRRLRHHAAQHGLRLIGDLPIFVAEDSVDVWSHPNLFQLGPDRRPSVVAGVPPDYFSATGQRWGNPLYDWEEHAADGYTWWQRRLAATFAQVDVVRIDHFRGFAAYWAIPADQTTAIHGTWQPGPGLPFFQAIAGALGQAPIIAEDLGLITPDVIALRDAANLPGMAVLQFAFGGAADNPYLPHNFRRRLVAYSGTHDNDTTAGWYASLDDSARDHLHRYLGERPADPARALARLALGSVAALALLPLPDLFSLGSEARMNRPGSDAGNWRWRLPDDLLREEQVGWLQEMTRLYGRGSD